MDIVYIVLLWMKLHIVEIKKIWIYLRGILYTCYRTISNRNLDGVKQV